MDYCLTASIAHAQCYYEKYYDHLKLWLRPSLLFSLIIVHRKLQCQTNKVSNKEGEWTATRQELSYRSISTCNSESKVYQRSKATTGSKKREAQAKRKEARTTLLSEGVKRSYTFLPFPKHLTATSKSRTKTMKPKKTLTTRVSESVSHPQKSRKKPQETNTFLHVLISDSLFL